MLDDAAAMEHALALARDAQRVGDVPVGAVLLQGGLIMARGHNRREQLQDPTAHAELEVLRAGALRLQRWRLTGCTLVVTLEPCAMCAYACVLARVDRVVYGASDPRFGAAGSCHQVLGDPRHNHQPAVVAGVLGDACSMLLKDFFRARRSV